MDMDLESSSPVTGLSSPNCANDPEEKEISDDDDDDRNHKHRKRETRSHSLDRDLMEQTLTQPYRKRNRPFENGQSNPQSHYNSDRDFSKYEKRRPTGTNFSRYSGEQGSGRGRGRDYRRDSRFGSIDVASQISHPGSIPPAMFSGRGLSNASSAQSASWSSFGLIPTIPNGTIDVINPLGLPGVLRPQLNPSLNMGIQRQRCRDFEERGFCLRGDMCPMEHGVNRIVVEDVQSLSQFNLPVSLPNAHVLGSSPGSGLLPSVGASSSALINSRGLHNGTSNSAADDALNFDGTFSGAVNASGGDVYDPDQPLWNSDGRETSSSLLGMQHPYFDEPEALLDSDLSDRLVRSSGAAVGSHSTCSSVWGRLNNSKHKMGLKEKFDSTTKHSESPESKSKEICEAPVSTQGTSFLGKNNGATFGPKTAGSIPKLQNDIGSSIRKPTQKAQRTLFVNGIPVKDNKKENLLSHFKKFGEVVDIYIPANSERAFVQFSKREEAERALKAPDAVMGSRFIKLWWANRDSIVDDGVSSGNNFSVSARDVSEPSASPHPVAVNKEKYNLQYPAPKLVVPKIPGSIVTAGVDLKPVASNSPKASPMVQKKMENLELLEELRKKQEMLEEKRNEFRRQLDKLAKQATGIKSELPAGQAVKRQKVETSADIAKAGNSQSANAITSGLSLQPEVLVENTVNVDGIARRRSKPNSAVALQDPLSLKQTLPPVATSGFPFHINRYKLDNRTKLFKINAPLPAGLASVATLRDHFSLFGEISDVEIEELGKDCQNGPNNSEEMRNCSARISFATRHSAERAFMNGKSWHGHNMHFVWITPSIPCSSRSSGESSPLLKSALNTEVQSADKTTDPNSHKASGDPTESNSIPAKPLNEVSCGSSGSGGRGNSPLAGRELAVSEAQSPDKSVSYIPLEEDEPENKDCDVPEEITGGDMQPGEDLKADPTLLSG